ncbi:wax ester/triacylglycerol synthase domain-containing protein [Rhodococcus chondri]|uniref:diacylglycerol O-acyltransferase n=1 Tax=Rhodococcus chondri TaxID=3065941 RepID=A0ABU7JTV8_9NOCA|nr:wax ester/triacylglycerol synthase domain-containing protein [Rhodococcus sp. CC-R104]MEE2033461.1 wax ester/triacylglycerol synthase family O-acyltransferase [Rhodococcus sp. CC-R104]
MGDIHGLFVATAMTIPSDVPISAEDTAILGINITGQPYVVTIAAMLSPGGFVDVDGRPDVERIRDFLEPRVAREAELQQRPERRDGRWWWVHVPVVMSAHITVESVSGDDGFETLCGRKVMEALPPDRPLWHIALVPGARPGRCGIVVRLHHAVVDGARASALLERLFDPVESPDTAEPPEAGAPRVTAARDGPSFGARLRHGLRMFLRRPVRSRVLLGPVSAARDVGATSVDLARLDAGARARGATVNDAYLFAVGQGLRTVLTDAGESIPDGITVSVPVRIASRDGTHNAVGVMLVTVPLAECEGALGIIAQRTSEAKPLARAAGSSVGSPRFTRLFNLFTRHQRVIATVASNVRGPRHVLALDGAPLTEMWALGPLAGNLRVGFTAASYAGRLSVGIECDAGHLTSASRIATSVGRALQSIADH